MSVEKNKEIIRRFYEAVNKHNPALIDEFVALNYVDHPRQLRGLDNYKQHLTMYYKSFPDSHETIEDIIAEGDKVCIRINGTATHKGEYRGLAPTGKKVTWEANTIFRIVNGKIAEMWAFSDELNFLKQLGVIKYSGQASTFTQK